jgi:ComF family protein
LRQRGFNQAELLANEVALTVSGELLTGALARHERKAQRTLGATARLTNLTHAIRCIRPDAMSGKRVLIVDDVVTTGATVSACADTLAEAGASRVSVLAFARDL